MSQFLLSEKDSKSDKKFTNYNYNYNIHTLESILQHNAQYHTQTAVLTTDIVRDSCGQQVTLVKLGHHPTKEAQFLFIIWMETVPQRLNSLRTCCKFPHAFNCPIFPPDLWQGLDNPVLKPLVSTLWQQHLCPVWETTSFESSMLLSHQCKWHNDSVHACILTKKHLQIRLIHPFNQSSGWPIAQ